MCNAYCFSSFFNIRPYSVHTAQNIHTKHSLIPCWLLWQQWCRSTDQRIVGKAGAITHIHDEAEAAGCVCLSPERVCPGNSTQTPSPVKKTHHHATCGTAVTSHIFIHSSSPYSRSESCRRPAQSLVCSEMSDWTPAAPWQASDGRAALQFPV